MFAVTIDLDAYDNLPPRQLKAMLRALRFADSEGRVHATLSMLATGGLSRSTAHRELAGLEEEGHVDRQQRPEGGFLWRIGRRFRCRAINPRPAVIERPGSWDAGRGESNADRGYLSPVGRPTPPDGTPVPPAETPVPQRGTTDSRAPPAVKNLSSGSKEEPSERELSLSQDEIPNGWREAATTERRRVDLPDVDLRIEWAKLVAHDEGKPISHGRWVKWALMARLDRTNTPIAGDSPTGLNPETLSNAAPPAGSDQERARARGWVRTGRWAPQGVDWGPAPDRPDCQLPPGLVAWCLRERAAQLAA